MTMRFELIGQDIAEFESQLRTMADLVSSFKQASPGTPVEIAIGGLDKMNLDELLKIVRERFDREGYEVTIIEKKVKSSADPEPKKAKGRPGKIDAETAKAQLAGASGGNGEDKSSEDEAAKADQEWSMALLIEMFADPKRKPKAMEFTSKVSRANNNIRVSDLPVGTFPEIRKQLEAEFGSL